MLETPYVLTTTVAPEEDGLMIKDLVYGRLALSRGLMRRLKRGGGVFLNGERDYLTRRLKAGDLVQIVFYDEQTGIEPEAIPLNIIYEDDYLLVVNKPAGMAVHPSGAYQAGTLVNALAFHWQKNDLKAKVRLVHRIDKDTSGLVLVAKEPYTLQRLLLQLRQQRLVREYLAVVQGCPEPPRGVITAAIGRSLDHGVKRAAVEEGGKAARSVYELIARGGPASLLRIRLESGRTHQIRVHLSAKGCPVLGDPLYSRPFPGSSGQALHAWRLEFVHPRTGRRHALSCPLPEDLRRLWQDCRRGENECLK